MHPSLTYDEGQRGLEPFVVSVFQENSDIKVVSSPILGVLWSFTKLIDKKLKQYPCIMKESLIYINTNIEWV